MPRISIKDFELANPIYRGASVTFYTVVSGAKSNIKASLYKDTSSPTQLANPQKLDSHGKFRQPVYIDVPVIGALDGISIPSHDTGIISPAPTFRVNALTSLLQYSFDGGVTWVDSLQFIFRSRGDWAAATEYKRLDMVVSGGVRYFAALDHTSTASFANDFASGDWLYLSAGQPAIVSTIADLKALSGAQLVGQVYVLGYYVAGDLGGGLFNWDGASSATANEGTIVQPNAGGVGRWMRLYQQPLLDRGFGVKTDGTDTLTRLQAAVDFCIANGVWLHSDAGTRNTSAPITIDTSSSQKGLRWTGLMDHTVVQCTDSAVPVAIRTGRNQSLDGITWRHTSMPTSLNTRGCGWEISGLVSQHNDGWNKFYKVYSAIQPAAAGVNAMFAGHCAHTIVHQYAHTALTMKALNGGNTPTFFDSIYTSNLADDGTTRLQPDSACVTIQSSDGPCIGHLHIENVKNNVGVFVGADVDGAKIGTLHVEKFEATAFGVMVDVSGSAASGRSGGLIIDHFQMLGSFFQFATTASNSFGLFRVGKGAQIICHHFTERGNTIDITDFRVAKANSGDALVDINSVIWVNGGNVITAAGGTYTTVLLTSDTQQDSNAGLLSLLRRWLGAPGSASASPSTTRPSPGTRPTWSTAPARPRRPSS